MSYIKKSPWLVHYDGSSCNGCDIEVLACLTPLYDVERFGIINTGNPKHAVGTWEMLQGVKAVQWEKALPDDPYLFVGILLLAGTSCSRKAPCKAMCLVSQWGCTE